MAHAAKVVPGRAQGCRVARGRIVADRAIIHAPLDVHRVAELVTTIKLGFLFLARKLTCGHAGTSQHRECDQSKEESCHACAALDIRIRFHKLLECANRARRGLHPLHTPTLQSIGVVHLFATRTV